MTQRLNSQHKLSGRQKWLAVMLAIIGLGGTGAFTATHNVQANTVNGAANASTTSNNDANESPTGQTQNQGQSNTVTSNDSTSTTDPQVNNGNNQTSIPNAQENNETAGPTNNQVNTSSRVYYTNSPASQEFQNTQSNTNNQSQVIHDSLAQNNNSAAKLHYNLTLPANNGYYGPSQHTVFLHGDTGNYSAPKIAQGQLGTDHSRYFDYGYVIGQAEEGVTVGGKPIWLHWHPASKMLHWWYNKEPGSLGGTSAPLKKKSGTWYFWVQPGALTASNKNGGGPSKDNTPTSNGNTSNSNTASQGSEAPSSEAPSSETPDSGGTGNGTNGGGNGTGNGNNNSVTPAGASTGNGTQGGGNGDSPNNGNPNNATVVTPSGPNNNNVIPGGSTSNNNLIPSGPIFNNTGDVDDKAVISALVNNEDRDEQDHINRYDNDTRAAESEAERRASQLASQSATDVSAAERGKDALQIAHMQESARMKSLTNSIAANSAQQSIQNSAASSKAAYMDRINSDHANMNSEAQDVLDEMSSLTNLTPGQKSSAVKSLQNEESSFMSAANTTDSTEDAGLNTTMDTHIHHLEASLRGDEASDQASQASSATSDVNSYSNNFNGFLKSFSGLTPDQVKSLNSDMSSDANTANSGIQLNKASDGTLNSLVTSIASDEAGLENLGKSTSTSNSNLAGSLATSSASSADNSLRGKTASEVNSVENNSSFSPEEKKDIVAALEKAEASDEASINAKIMAGRGSFIGGSAAKSANGNDNLDKSILDNPTNGMHSSNRNGNPKVTNTGYNPYGYNIPRASVNARNTKRGNTEARRNNGGNRQNNQLAFHQGYEDAKHGQFDASAMDNSPEYREGYNAYMNGYHDGLNGSPALKSFYQEQGEPFLQGYLDAYNKGLHHTDNAGDASNLNTSTNSTNNGSHTTLSGTSASESTNTANNTGEVNANPTAENTSFHGVSVNNSGVHTSIARGNSGTSQRGKLPQTGEQPNKVAEAGAGAAGLGALGAAVMDDIDKRRHSKEKKGARK